jgi:PAS domain S-box-containing protein
MMGLRPAVHQNGRLKASMQTTDRGHEALTLAGFVAAALAVAGLLGATYWISDARTEAARWVMHTHEVRTAIAATRAAAADARGSPSEAARAFLGAEVSRLATLTADNPAQQRRIERMKVLLGQARDAIDMDEARTVLASLDSEERRLLEGREETLRRDIALFWLAAGTIAAAILVALVVLYGMVRRRAAGERARLESEQRFHLFTQSVADYAMLMLDPGGRVASWNSGAERIKGYAASEIVGKHFSIFFPPEEAASGKPAAELEIAARTGRYEEEGWRVRKDGSRFWAHVVITALRAGDGRLSGFGKVTRDLTARKRADDALRAEVEQRRAAELRLAQANSSLEERVGQRTAELTAANADLAEAKARLQGLSARLITAQEEERKRIARELHDETGQALTGIKLRLKDALRGDSASRQIEECLAIVDQAVVHIRGLAVNLRPPMLDDLGLADALEWALDQQAKAAGWRASLEAHDYDERLAPDIETACFRIGQEALTNAARHAQASVVRVELRVAHGQLELVVADDGTGFDENDFATPEERRKHFGLVSMRERAMLAGGSLEVDSGHGKGTRIHARFPLTPPH